MYLAQQLHLDSFNIKRDAFWCIPLIEIILRLPVIAQIYVLPAYFCHYRAVYNRCPMPVRGYRYGNLCDVTVSADDLPDTVHQCTLVGVIAGNFNHYIAGLYFLAALNRREGSQI